MSTVSRRDFLKLLLAGAAVSGCSPLIDQRLAPDVVTSTRITPESTASDQVQHLLNRATFGATPALVQTVRRQGIQGWLNQQLAANPADDWQLSLRLRRLNTLSMTAPDLLSFTRLPDKHLVANELAAAMLLRALYSPQQLYEVLVNFWNDHFSIYYLKDRTPNLLTVHDRDVIRPHTLGTFEELLRSTAHSPAMLIYLDNVANERSHPNENYAREIMELHTLGVNGSYTEEDVREVARCFTGWSVGRDGRFAYRADWHDDGEKHVLGHVIPAGGGKSDGDRVLSILSHHPDTARYLTTKLLRRFVQDDPSQAMVTDISRTWQQSGGNITQVMQAIFAHDNFWKAPRKFKRPLEYAISALRALRATYDGSSALVERLDRMGQRPFGSVTPDGYADTADEWAGSLVPRWNFVQDVVNGGIAGVTVPLSDWQRHAATVESMAQTILLRSMTQEEQQAVQMALRDASSADEIPRTGLSVLLSSPAFQWR